MADNKNKEAEFNNTNEREGMQEAFQQEHQDHQDDITKTGNDLSMGDSIRDFGEVSGTTFGAESNPAKFSNMGQKNQTHKGEGDSNMQDANKADKQKGSGGTMDSDYLYKAENQFISGTGQFANNEGDKSTKSFDAMQGNRDSSSGSDSRASE